MENKLEKNLVLLSLSIGIIGIIGLVLWEITKY